MKVLLLTAIATAVTLAAPLPDSLYRLYATHDFDRAGAVLEQRLEDAGPADLFAVRREWGDFLLDKRHDYAGAEAVYLELLEEKPDDPGLRYRLALAQELMEEYLEAARNYEFVATRHMDSRFGEDALEAIERCFRKNYQDRVAYVDGYPVTRIELDDRISRNPAAHEEYERKEFLLDTMVDNRLLRRAALDAGLMDDPEFARAWREMRNRHVFEAWHTRNVTDRAEPTERELQAAYRRERAARFTTPERVHGWRLVVRERSTADSLRRLLLGRDAVPWETLATRHTIAPDSARAGDLGLFNRGMRDPAIEDAAFRLRPGQVSRPVSLDTAWALVRVTERIPSRVTPYDEARNQLVNIVRQEKTEQLYDDRLAELIGAVEIHVDTAALDAAAETVGSVDGIPITSAALNRRLEQIPAFFRAQFQTPEGIRRILEQYIHEYLILKDAEASHDWLSDHAVSRTLDRRARMLTDLYTRKMTADKVVIDTADVRAEYRAGIDEFRVPARARAREISARTRARALRLHRWARDGRLPALASGRALLITDPELDDIGSEFALTDDPDAFAADYGFSEAPRVVLPGTPTIRTRDRLVPDMSRRHRIAGPYRGTGAYSMGFADLAADDTLFLPERFRAADGEQLAALLETEPAKAEDGTVLVDKNRLGSYVRFEQPMSRADYRALLAGNDDVTAFETADGRLLVRVTGRDTAAAAAFEDIARRFSTAPSRHSGGDMHWFDRDDQARDSRLVEAAFRLSPGSLSPVIEINDSTWTFILLEEREQARVRPLEEVWSKVEAGLRSRRTEQLRDRLLADLRAQAEIKILMTPEDFIFDPLDDPPVETEPDPDPTEAPALEE